MISQHLVRILLESDNPPSARSLIEASVHLPTRSTVFVASFRNEKGRQIQRTTGQRDRARAQAIADQWEAQAKKQRAHQPAPPGKPTIRVRGFLSHAEIAAIMRLSERTVRKTEAEALRKLFHHPELRALWKEYTTGEVKESHLQAQVGSDLSRAEVDALLGLARTPFELRALIKLLVVTGTPAIQIRANLMRRSRL
jgi:hypothetical protein